MVKVEYSLTPSRINNILEGVAKSGDQDKIEAVEWLEPYRETGIPFSGEYDFGETADLDGLRARFGDELVYSYGKQSIGLWLGTRVRNMLEAGLSTEDIQAKLLDPEFKPSLGGFRKPRKDVRDQYLDSMADKSLEDKLAEIEKMKEALLAMSEESNDSLTESASL